MKKVIFNVILFLGMVLISGQVYAIDNGSVRCQYTETKEGSDVSNRITLVFDVSDNVSTLNKVIQKKGDEDTLETDGSEYTFSKKDIVSVSKCPSNISISGKKINTTGSYTLLKSGSSENEVVSWLDDDDKVSCANIGPFSSAIPKTTSLMINVATIIASVLFAIMGTVDLFKASMSGKEDVIKKNQKAFTDRIVAAILIFLIVVLTKLFISIITAALGTNAGIVECIDCFISNNCK